MTIVVLYVCQSCGWAPKFDYDYCVTKKAWWCAHCGEQYDKHIMQGAFGIIFKDELLGESFLSRIRMPDGGFSNLIVFLKFPNLIRVGSYDINEDDLSCLPEFIACLKKIIGNDTIVAAKSLQSIGAKVGHCPLVAPTGVDFRGTLPIRETDGLTLKSTDGGRHPSFPKHPWRAYRTA